MDIDQRLARVAELEQQIARLQAEQARHIAALVDDPGDGSPAPLVDKDYLREEVRVLLRESAVMTNHRIHTARTLVHRLPRTLAGMEAGELTLRHATAVCDTVLGLSDEEAGRLETVCVPFAAGRDYTAFTRKLRRELHHLNPPAQQRQVAAALENRKVWCSANPDGGTATLGAVLPADGAQLVLTAVNTAADQRPADDGRGPAEDGRTRDQRRADGLVRIAQDWLNNLATGSAAAGGLAASGAGAAGGAGGRVGPSVQVTIAASTLLGLDNQPGDLDGHGPLPAALARAIAADPTGTWRRLITDQRGRLLDYGRRQYRPGTVLTEFVRARDRECQFPGCHRHAQHCEIDHRIAWADGGPTTAQNLICLCPRHHHLKHEAGWTVHALPDGTLRWTSPHHRSHDNHPATYPTTASDSVVPEDNGNAERTGIVVSEGNGNADHDPAKIVGSEDSREADPPESVVSEDTSGAGAVDSVVSDDNPDADPAESVVPDDNRVADPAASPLVA